MNRRFLRRLPPNTADCSGDSTNSDVPSHPLVTLEFVADQTINLALQQNRIPVIKRVRVQNVSDQNLSNLEVRIEALINYFEVSVLTTGRCVDDSLIPHHRLAT